MWRGVRVVVLILGTATVTPSLGLAQIFTDGFESGDTCAWSAQTVPCPGSIVISEVATAGPNGAADEFVELYNRTGTPINLGGLVIEYQAAAGASFSPRCTFGTGTVIPALGFALAVSTAYIGDPVDCVWGSVGMSSSGGHVRARYGSLELDRLGWGTAAAPETAAIPAVSDAFTQTYERKAVASSTSITMQGGSDELHGNGWDTDDNSADFIERSVADPQSTASPTESP